MRAMSKDFFNIQISRLKSTYGEKQFPRERIEMYWEKYHMVPAVDFKAAVNRLILNSRYAPMAQDFDDALYEPLLRLKEVRASEISQKGMCQGCKNTGRVSIKINKAHAPYSFRCYCNLGLELFPNFPSAPRPKGKSAQTKRDQLSEMDF